MREFQLISTHPIKKSDLGFHGNLFGGKLLSWLDAAGAAYAMEVCDTPRMVTKKISEVVFNNTSLTLLLECRAHNVYTGKQSPVLTTTIKFVRIDENGDPIPISERVKNKYPIFK